MPAMIDTTHNIRALHAQHCALLEADAPDEAIDAVLDRYTAAFRDLSTCPAHTVEELREKARALATCVRTRRGGPSEVVGDQGVAASLIADILAISHGVCR